MAGLINGAVEPAARALDGSPGPSLPEEPVEAALADALSAARQHTVHLKNWHGKVGAADIAVDSLGGGVGALIEVKSGGSALWNCSWDVAKLALCIAEGQSGVGAIAAAARAEDWRSRPSGAELFEERAWRLDLFLDRFADCFAYWSNAVQTRPRALPAEWAMRTLEPETFLCGGEPWELRAALVENVADDLLPIAYAPRIASWRRGVSVPDRDDQVKPLRKPPEGSRSISVEDSELLGAQVMAGEGGDVSALERFGLISDEGTLAEMLDPGDIRPDEARSLQWFRSAAERRAHLDHRGWKHSGSPEPEVFFVSAGAGLGSSFELSWNASELTYSCLGRGPNDAPAVIRPREHQWRALWQRLDQLDVWMWRHTYEPVEMVTDGYGWRVRISVGGRTCDSSGYQRVPGRDRGGPTATWDGFLLALSDLVGRRALV